MRFFAFRICAAVALAACALCAPAQAGVSQGPPHRPFPPAVDEAGAYQADAAHDGRSTAILRFPLHIRWVRNVGGQYYTSPVIAGGRVAVSVGFSVIALNAANGNVLWSSPAPQGWTGVAEANGILYAAQAFGGPLLQAFDLATGRTLWSQPIPDPDNIDPPVVSGGVVYVAGGAPTTLFAFRAGDGRPLWSQPFAYEDFGTTPAVADGGVYVSYVCSGTFAFTLAGTPLWHFPGACSGVGGSAPAYFAGAVYVQGSVVEDFNTVYEGLVLNARSGAVVNTFQSSVPALTAGRAFVTTGYTLQAINFATAQVFWTARIGPDEFLTPPLLVGNVVVAETASGTLYAYDAVSGRLLQTIALGAPLNGIDGYLPTGLAAAQGILVAPAGNYLFALSGS